MMKKTWYEQQQDKEQVDAELAEASSRKVYRTYESFVADYPKYADPSYFGYFSDWDLYLPVMARYSCMSPGFYLAKLVKPSQKYPMFDVIVNDGDDFYIRKICMNLQEAQEALEMLVSFAPASMGEIVDMKVGFEWD